MTQGIQIDRSGRMYAIGSAWRTWLARHSGVHHMIPEEGGRLPLDQCHDDVPKEAVPGEIALAGAIEHFDNPLEIIDFLSNARRSGRLDFCCARHKRTLVLLNGDIVAARSTERSDRLGQVLYRTGAIAGSALADAAYQARDQRQPLGNFLVQRGHISRRELDVALHQQVHDVVLGILSLLKGDFLFTVDPPNRRSRTVSMKAQAVLMDGLRRLDEIRHAESRLGNPRRDKLAAVEGSEKQHEFPAVLTDVLGALREPLTLSELCDRVQHSRRTILEALYRGFNEGLVTIEDATAAPAPVTPMLEGLAGEGETLSQYNSLGAAIYRATQTHNAPHAVERSLRSFRQFYGYTSLFRGVRIQDDGQLDMNSLLINVAALDREGSDTEYMARALSEFVSFTLTAIRSHLGPEELRRLSSLARKLRSEL